MNDDPAIDGVCVTPLRRILHEKGDVFHALKSSEEDFEKFGEAYFTTVLKGSIKGWKRHHRMKMNLIVPVGTVRFYIRSADGEKSFNVEIGDQNYARLCVEAGNWVAFEGQGDFNLVLNIASIEHDPNEASDAPIDTFPLESVQ